MVFRQLFVLSLVNCESEQFSTEVMLYLFTNCFLFQSEIRSQHNGSDSGGASPWGSDGGLPRLQGDGAADHQVVSRLPFCLTRPSSAPPHTGPGSCLHRRLLVRATHPRAEAVRATSSRWPDMSAIILNTSYRCSDLTVSAIKRIGVARKWIKLVSKIIDVTVLLQK